jgi:hypothetical protein
VKTNQPLRQYGADYCLNPGCDCKLPHNIWHTILNNLNYRRKDEDAYTWGKSGASCGE